MKHFFTFQTGGALRTLLILRVPYICKKMMLHLRAEG